MARRLTFGFAAILALDLLASWLAGSAMVAPRPMAIPDPPPPAEAMTTVASDGAAVAGSYWPGRSDDSPAVLMLHGVQSNRLQHASTAAWLAARGYAVLAIDFRGHGESARRPRSFGVNEARDAAAALAWLRRRQPARRIAVVGTSMGGAAALLGEDGPLDVDALVLQAVYPDIRHAIRNRIAERLGRPIATLLEPLLSFQTRARLGIWPDAISPMTAIAAFKGSVLVIGGGDDRSTPPAESRALAGAVPRLAGLWIVPGLGHAETTGLASDDYRRRIARFLAVTIGAPAPPAAPPPSPAADRS